jgi:hypothetical protein
MMRTPFSIVQQIKSTLAKDPKKTSLVCGLITVTCLLWLRMWSNGPASATASLTGHPLAVENIVQSPNGSSPSTNAVLEWLSKPRKELGRNLFAMRLDGYPKTDGSRTISDRSEDPAKSQLDAVDQNGDRSVQTARQQTQRARQEIIDVMNADVLLSQN